MGRFEHIFFDLDGTLTDPAEGITNSIAYVLDYYKIDYPSKKALERHIGPPLHKTFITEYGFDENSAELAIQKYREYFSDKGIFENRLFDGIPEMLSGLKAKSKKIYLATSKPQYYAKKILEHFDIAKYFDFVSGCELDGTRSQKTEVIEHICENVGLKDLSTSVMVGDRKYDIEGAHHFGMPCIAVLFGYGSMEEFKEAKADYIVESVEELYNLLIS